MPTLLTPHPSSLYLLHDTHRYRAQLIFQQWYFISALGWYGKREQQKPFKGDVTSEPAKKKERKTEQKGITEQAEQTQTQTRKENMGAGAIDAMADTAVADQYEQTHSDSGTDKRKREESESTVTTGEQYSRECNSRDIRHATFTAPPQRLR